MNSTPAPAMQHPICISIIGGFIALLIYHVYISCIKTKNKELLETHYIFYFITTSLIVFFCLHLRDLFERIPFICFDVSNNTNTNMETITDTGGTNSGQKSFKSADSLLEHSPGKSANFLVGQRGDFDMDIVR